MIRFLLNNESVETDLPPGFTVLDFVRYKKNLKGTKIGCREGDCGACTVLVGEPNGQRVRYRSMTSCLMPLANASGKHIVTVEGINPADGGLTPAQKALVEQNGTQCGFCTVGFVMSMTGFCLDNVEKTRENAVSWVDGNICRCTGYKSIERAAEDLCENQKDGISGAVEMGHVPAYFEGIMEKLVELGPGAGSEADAESKVVVGGGTDLYVQRPDEMTETRASHVFFDPALRLIRESGGFIEIGASTTVTDLLESRLMNDIFPDLYEHLKLVSSTPIRNMATLAGNFVNASPIGDMTVWFLALDASVVLDSGRELPLREFYLGYKKLAKSENESIRTIRFERQDETFCFGFEKVCKRKFLDIATVNTAMSLTFDGDLIKTAHVAAGGVAPVPLYLKETSAFLAGRGISAETISGALELIDDEISPISDVRGSAEYKRLLLKQLFKAHFLELGSGGEV